jgi:anaerobic selenocysteine-containing dehydrogenase
MEQVLPTVCQECWNECGVLVHVEDDKIKEIVGNPAHPVTKGYICNKGSRFTEAVYHKDRLLHPLKRVGARGEGKWRRISWDEALSYAADAILKIRRTHGPQAFAMFDHHVFRDPIWTLFERFVGNNNVIGCLDRCDGPAYITDYAVFGAAATCILEWDYENSGCIIVWGANPPHSFPPYWKDVRQAKGAKILVVDPVHTKSARKADLWLQPRPGSDPALALAMLNVIINEDLYDKKFVEQWCTGFDRLRPHVQQYAPEDVEELTWVPAQQIREAARMIGTAKSACFTPLRTGAVAHKKNATQTALAHSIMLAITGNIDVPGGNLFVKPYEGFTYAADFHYNKKYRLAPEVEEQTLGRAEYPLYPEACHLAANSSVVWEAMLEGKVKGAFVVANDPVMTHADTQGVLDALHNLDFLLVSEYVMSPTAEHADLVLPAATWCERDDFRAKITDCIAIQQAVAPPPADCWDDKKMVIELVKRLKAIDYPEAKEFPWESVEEFNAYRLRNAGVTFDELRKTGFLAFSKKYRSYEKNGFKTPSGKVELCPSRFEKYGHSPLPEHFEPSESEIATPQLASEYPLILLTGCRELEFFHSSQRQLPWVRKIHPQPRVYLHPSTAGGQGIVDGDRCWIVTPRGKVKMVAALTDRVHPKVVSAQHGWWFPEHKTTNHGVNESNINLVTDRKTEHADPVIGGQTFKGLLCTIEKFAG